MKRILSIVLIILLLLSLFACKKGGVDVAPEPIEPISTQTVEVAPESSPMPLPTKKAVNKAIDLYGTDDGTRIKTAEIKDIKSTIDKSDNITLDEPLDVKVYDEESLLFSHYHVFDIGIDSGYYNFTPNNRPDFLNLMITVFPEVTWRKMDTGFRYAVIDSDGGSRVFLFYPIQIDSNVTLSGYPIVMNKKLSYKDFKDIKMSDTSEQVNSIDPITEYYIRNYNTCNDFSVNFMLERGNKLVTVHLLTDGILKYTYERSGEEGNYVYTIVDIEYHEDFKMEGLGGVTDYSIAEVDYVD